MYLRTIPIFMAICCAAVVRPGQGDAGTPRAALIGSVVRNGAPVAHVEVVAAGNGTTARTVSDARGRFAFAPLPLGTYVVTVALGSLSGRAEVDLGSSGADATIALQPLAEIGHVVSVGEPQVIRGSGADVVLNGATLARMPFNNSFSEMQIQQPGAVRGANGVVHMNGDHGVIAYILDGVALPQELNRDIGGEIDLNDLAFVDIVEGAYPAQYGLKFGSVFNMTTRSGAGTPGFYGDASAGSFAQLQSTIGYHAPLFGGGGYDVSLDAVQSARGLDPPNPDSPHDAWSSIGQFARFTVPAGKNDFTNVTFINSRATFQIPNDVRNGEPAATDDDETQADTFLALQFHRAIGTSGFFSFGPAYKASTIRDFGDPDNDFVYGERLNVARPPYGNGGRPTDCANAPADPAAFGPTTCAYSLTDQRTALDYILQADYSRITGPHTVTAGVTYDLTRVLKNYRIELQPGNFLAPIATPLTPGAIARVVDSEPNVGNTYQSFVQDSWRPSERYEADYGMRYDFFSVASPQFREAFGALSPRLKVVRFFGKRASLYAYVGRFFEPFSFENVSPAAAQLLNLPLQRTVAHFDLKPERDTQLEFGGHLPIGAGDLGFRIWQKNANDLIDDTQVGVTLLHQDINYVLGRLSQESVNYVLPLQRNGRAYLSLAHGVSLNKGCETQLLAPCFGSPTAFTPADHEQRWSAASGVLLNDRRGGWFSGSLEYGSGLSSAGCATPVPGYCKYSPHTVVNLEKGVAVAPSVALYASVQNLLDHRYLVTYLNAQGTHWAPPRAVTIGVRFSR